MGCAQVPPHPRGAPSPPHWRRRTRTRAAPTCQVLGPSQGPRAKQAKDRAVVSPSCLPRRQGAFHQRGSRPSTQGTAPTRGSCLITGAKPTPRHPLSERTVKGSVRCCQRQARHWPSGLWNVCVSQSRGSARRSAGPRSPPAPTLLPVPATGRRQTPPLIQRLRNSVQSSRRKEAQALNRGRTEGRGASLALPLRQTK